ncbi:MAG TPA: efflux RND transporter periplasmic adaptor subunit [Labilithrix sp.]
MNVEGDVSPPPVPSAPQRSFGVVLAIAIGALALVAAGAGLYLRARSRVNDRPLAAEAKPVTVIVATSGSYRPSRHYVATLEPWVSADVGPQMIAAFVDTVLVRPGATVKRGQVLATLDCRESTATNQAIAMQARAIETKQKALSAESARVHSLLDGGFVAPNEAEQKLAGSEAELADLLSTQAKLAGTSLAVNDCILRAPFDGEVARRAADPGAFVRPGTPIVSIVDRSTIRVTAEVPEADFAAAEPGTPVKIQVLATGALRTAEISRRSPRANASTRTVHFEIDLADPERTIPVGTTAELTIDVGTPEPATVIPGTAAAVRADKAVVFVVDGDHAKKVVVAVKGEEVGVLFLDPQLTPGTRVVTEGRSLLSDGDKIVAKLEAKSP